MCVWAKSANGTGRKGNVLLMFVVFSDNSSSSDYTHSIVTVAFRRSHSFCCHNYSFSSKNDTFNTDIF